MSQSGRAWRCALIFSEVATTRRSGRGPRHRARRDVINYVVHHEATFDRDELRRHVTVLVLTETD